MCKIDPIFHPNFVSQFGLTHSEIKEVFDHLYSSYLDTFKNIKLKSKQLVQSRKKKADKMKEENSNFDFPLKKTKQENSSSLVERKFAEKENINRSI
jgi:hypothetical protein